MKGRPMLTNQVAVVMVDADVLTWHLSFKATNPRLLYPVESFPKFLLPLVAQVERADDRQLADYVPVQHLSGDHAGLNGFADTSVVSDSRTGSIRRALMRGAY